MFRRFARKTFGISQILSRLRACYRTQDAEGEVWKLGSLVTLRGYHKGHEEPPCRREATNLPRLRGTKWTARRRGRAVRARKAHVRPRDLGGMAGFARHALGEGRRCRPGGRFRRFRRCRRYRSASVGRRMRPLRETKPMLSGKMGTAKTQLLQERWGANAGRTVVRPPAPHFPAPKGNKEVWFSSRGFVPHPRLGLISRLAD